MNATRLANKLDGLALDTLFRTARTPIAWTDRAVTERQLRELYDLMKFGPTSSNCCPARFVWVTSSEGKAKLAALAAPGNAPKVVAAPVTVIVGYDLDFSEQLPKLFPARGKQMQTYFSDPVVDANHRISERQPSRRLLDYRSTGIGIGLRSDVRLQYRGS